MIDTSKPLRTSRVEVSRFTRDTEPSNGREWRNTKAFSPGLARMSSKIFSSVLYSESTPASPRGEPMVIGMKPPGGCGYLDTYIRCDPAYPPGPGLSGRCVLVHVMRWLPGIRRMMAERTGQGTA